ncbi:unnamed protein product [Phaedon cochleariae]|uniref:SAM domain-containing protein n=1 Tax=Phaedon cochleariae TaxID=80249 RepID=A0A9P0DJ77_PHACE|nr:unnamed protein product [Phaedon cochleariae]
MDLLQTILRSCQSENYYNNFKNSGIDSYTLKLLTEEDLEDIGIENVVNRKKILKHFSNLQIPTEKKINLIVDQQYTQLVLTQMSEQLHRHLAILTYALKRQDVYLCKITLTPSMHCLSKMLQDIEKKLETFEHAVLTKKKRRNNKVLIIMPTIFIGSLAAVVCYKHIFSVSRS